MKKKNIILIIVIILVIIGVLFIICNKKDNNDGFEKTYISDKSFKVEKNYCMPTETAFNFEIKNGVLYLTNLTTSDRSILKDINNFKSIAYVKTGTSCNSYSLYLLTKDGNVYETTIPLSDIKDVKNINSIFKLVDLSIKVDDIGILSNMNRDDTTEALLLKDTNNNEYYYLFNKLNKLS